MNDVIDYVALFYTCASTTNKIIVEWMNYSETMNMFLSIVIILIVWKLFTYLSTSDRNVLKMWSDF